MGYHSFYIDPEDAITVRMKARRISKEIGRRQDAVQAHISYGGCGTNSLATNHVSSLAAMRWYCRPLDRVDISSLIERAYLEALLKALGQLFGDIVLSISSLVNISKPSSFSIRW